jgi:predicted DCC family thiol-disulfide oxidoreductase YuxK
MLWSKLLSEPAAKAVIDHRHLVIFDGVCNFCNGAVNFIIKRDPAGLFAFTPMQTEFAKSLLAQHQIQNVGVETFVLIKHGECLIYSTAALEIAKDLTGFWYLFGLCKWLPVSFRDYFYQLFARNRYRLFGRQDSCMMPDEQIKARFLGV